MMPGYSLKPRSITLPGKKWLYLAGGACLMAIIVFSCFYLLHSYEYLKHWFLELNGCFYHKESWETRFFTPETKKHGNTCCLTALLLAAPGLAICCYKFMKSGLFQHIKYGPDKRGLWYGSLLMLTTIGLWIWGNATLKPSYDEVFSALKCAGMHPFGTLSYYMLPNNHIFFNLLNNIFFHYCRDPVFTGRLISGAAYVALMVLIYNWLATVMKSRFLAFAVTITLAMQLPVWGFAVQGRGYSLYLLCEWGAFISLLQYLKRGDRRSLTLHTLANVVGFITIPSYLFFYTALVSLQTISSVFSRKASMAYWKYTAASWVAVYLSYVPALCFSGAGSLFSNDFVRPVTETAGQFFPLLMTKLRESIQYCFSGDVEERTDIFMFLFLLPLTLLIWYWHKGRMRQGLMFLLIWILFSGASLYLRRYPFMRNLNGHYSFTLAFVILSGFYLVKAFLERLNREKWLPVIFTVLLLPLAAHLFLFDRDHGSSTLYFYDINKRYELVHKSLAELPPRAALAFGDEEFYWEHTASKMGFNIIHCSKSQEDYLIKQGSEPLPPDSSLHYSLVQQVLEYQVYQRH